MTRRVLTVLVVSDSSCFFCLFLELLQPTMDEGHSQRGVNAMNLTSTGGRGASTMEGRCAQKCGAYHGGGDGQEMWLSQAMVPGKDTLMGC